MTDLESADNDTFESVVLLYLACAKLTDGDLAMEEAERILAFTRQHTRDLAPSYATSVIRDAASRLASLTEPQVRLAAVAAAAERLAVTLDDDAKEALVERLDALTRVDGSPSSPERAFVEAVAKTLGLATRA